MLRLTKLRELTLPMPPQADRPRHLSAASGLVGVGEFLYVVADDENHLGVFSAAGDAGIPAVLSSVEIPGYPFKSGG